MTSTVPAGWYPDPASSQRQRYFDGNDWSPWVFAAAGMTLVPLDEGQAAPPTAVDVMRVILHQATADGVISATTLAALLRYTHQWTTPRPTTPGTTQPEAARGVAREHEARLWESKAKATPSPRSADSPAPLLPAAVPRQNSVSRWWQETRETVKSDLAVHGLAYLGVLLLFAGVFGLVVWSFSDINTAMRPVAELAIPVALFAAAAMLNRRGTRVVAGALEVAGGLLLPIVTVASFVDDAPVPPDPSGVGLTVGLAAATLAIAGGYALWVRRRPTSALAYLVAPVVWLALGLLSLSWLDPIPSGQAVATPRATEVAVMTAAAGVTLLLARLRPTWPFAQATLTTGPISLGVLAVLALLAGSNDGWASTPAVVTAAGIVLGLEALATRLPGPAATIATSVSVGLGLLAARSGLDDAPWVAALAFAGATWWADYHRRGATGRERRSYAAPAALFPLGAALALVAALEWATGLLAVALLLLTGALVIKAINSPDRFWTHWLTGAVGVVAGGLVAVASVDLTWPGGASTADLPGSWQPALVCVLLMSTLLVAPSQRLSVLPWAVVALVAEAWAFTVPLVDAASSLTVEGWASGAAALVVVSAVAPRPWLARVPSSQQGHFVLAALALGLLSWIVAADTESVSSATLAIVSCAVAIAWAAVSLTEELTGSAAVSVVADRLDARAAEKLRWIPPTVAAVAIVVAALTSIEHFGWVSSDAWWPVVPVALALLFIALARGAASSLPRIARVSVESALLLAVAAAVTALALTDTGGEFEPTLIVLLTVLVVCAVVPRQLRDARPAWLGWAATAALVLQLVDEWAGPPGDTRSRALLVWGGCALLLGLTVERLPREFWMRRLIRYPLPPVFLGGAGLALGALLTAATEPFTTTGWWFLAVAAVCVVAAYLSREGTLLGAAALALTVTYAALAPWDPVATPWTLVALGAAWLLAADVARGWPPVGSLPRAVSALFWAGHIVIVVALTLSVDDNQRPLGLVVAGVVAFAIAARIPVRAARPWYAGVGVVLVLVGAGDAGPGWLALALASLSVAATTASALDHGLSRRAAGALRWLGAFWAAASWASYTVWADWSAETTVIATALVAGLLVAASGVAAQLVSRVRPWVESWGGVALVTVLAALIGLGLPEVPREPAGQMVAGGLALSAVGSALAARPLSRSLLRVATTILAALAVCTFLYGISATTTQIVIVAALLAAAVTVATAVVAATRRGTRWRPALLVAVVLT
ncbi:MAG: DUF2510 domain-containing protein, partial [Actinomycetes bacterium]